MPPPQHYDAIVIGSDRAALRYARRFANAGLRTALSKRFTSAAHASTKAAPPRKRVVASGRVAYLARRGPDYGVHTGTLRINMERVRKRKRGHRQFVFRSGGEKRIANTQKPRSDLWRRILHRPQIHRCPDPPKRGETPLHRRSLFPECRLPPRDPNIPGLAGVPFLTSTSIMELAKFPRTCSCWRRLRGLGSRATLPPASRSRVTIIQSAAQLLGHERPGRGTKVSLRSCRKTAFPIHLTPEWKKSPARNRITR